MAKSVGKNMWKKSAKIKLAIQMNAKKRHPRICRYYSVFKRCKFGEYCAFDHDVPLDPILEEIKVMNDRMKALEKQIIDKNYEINAVMENLEKALCFMNPRPEVLTTSNNCRVYPCPEACPLSPPSPWLISTGHPIASPQSSQMKVIFIN